MFRKFQNKFQEKFRKKFRKLICKFQKKKVQKIFRINFRKT